ncbi:MAG: hypothetical protein WAW92_02205 [Minisyncoccia bacterium]
MQNLASVFNFSWFSLQRAQDIYTQFLNNFPIQYQPVVSVIIGVFIVYVVYRIIKRDFIFIVLLVVLVPASIPVLKSVWLGLVTLLKYLFNIT